MKNICLILTAVFAFAGLSGCQKDGVDKVDFNVMADKQTISVDDSVTFNFTGYADIITFYSGEKGKEYENRTRTLVDGAKLELTIQTRVLYGNQHNLRLMYSTSFPGVYNKDNINEERDWVDITDRFTWSTAGPNALGVNTLSGPVDITDILEKDRPVYFGFKYESQAASVASQGGRTWRIPTFDLVSVLPDGTRSSVATIRNVGFTNVPVISSTNVTTKWAIFSSGADYFLQFVPNNRVEQHLYWAISPAFRPGTVSPDLSNTIKTYLDRMKTSYKHKFSQPGTYKVTFVGKNVNANGQKEVVREIEILVE